MENIFFNGLLSPMEMNEFADSFDSDHVHVHFDTGNIAFQFRALIPSQASAFEMCTSRNLPKAAPITRWNPSVPCRWHDQLAGGDGGI